MTTEKNDLLPEDQAWLQQQLGELSFGRMLKAHRMSMEWTQEEAAGRLNIQKQLLSAYENGRKIPSPKTAYAMAEQLGILPETAVLAVLNDQLQQDHLPIKVCLAG